MAGRQIKGWGDSKQGRQGFWRNCIDYLAKHPELKKQGYRVVKLHNTWVVAK